MHMWPIQLPTTTKAEKFCVMASLGNHDPFMIASYFIHETVQSDIQLVIIHTGPSHRMSCVYW